MTTVQVFNRPFKTIIDRPSDLIPYVSADTLNVHTDETNDGYWTGAGVFFGDASHWLKTTHHGYPYNLNVVQTYKTGWHVLFQEAEAALFS